MGRSRKRATPLSELRARPLYTQRTNLKISFTAALREVLEQDPDALTTVMEVIVEKAIGGDLKAIEMLMDRIDGKVVAPFAITGLENLSDEQLAAYREALKSSKGGDSEAD